MFEEGLLHFIEMVNLAIKKTSKVFLLCNYISAGDVPVANNFCGTAVMVALKSNTILYCYLKV